MASLRHPCIIQFMGLCLMPPCLVTGQLPVLHRKDGRKPAADSHERACCDVAGQPVSLPRPHTHVPAEYCARGSLYDVLRAAATNPARAAELTWRRRLSLALDAAMGLLYLHSRSPTMIHRDGAVTSAILPAHQRQAGGPLQLPHRACRTSTLRASALLLPTLLQ